MLYENLNILSVNTDENLTRLLHGILGSVGYQLHSEQAETFPFQLLSEQVFHLLIIDHTALPFKPHDLKKIQLVNPDIHTILIHDDLNNLDDWSDLKNLNIIGRTALPERLPLILSHFYSEFSEHKISNLTYWELVKNALYENNLFTAIVDKNADIIFLNRTAQEVLKVRMDADTPLNFADKLKEGQKVWNYIRNKFKSNSQASFNIQLDFMDGNFNEISFPALIVKGSDDGDHFIIYGTSLGNVTSHPALSSEALLNAFAESLANELLNPLNVIWGRLQLFQASARLGEQDHHHLAMVERQIQRINEVIGRLVSFTSIKRDLVPQKIFLNDILQRLLFQPSLKSHSHRLQTKFAPNLPSIYGQVAHIELLFNMIIDLILNLTPAKSKIILSTRSQTPATDGQQNVVAQVEIQNYTEVLDQYLLKNSLQFKDTGKMKFALELTIIRFILDEYHIRHELREDKSSLILSLSFANT